MHLSATFRRLSGQRGDAYCSHADDTRLAFAQGLEFHVRSGHTSCGRCTDLDTSQSTCQILQEPSQ